MKKVNHVASLGNLMRNILVNGHCVRKLNILLEWKDVSEGLLKSSWEDTEDRKPNTNTNWMQFTIVQTSAIDEPIEHTLTKPPTFKIEDIYIEWAEYARL